MADIQKRAWVLVHASIKGRVSFVDQENYYKRAKNIMEIVTLAALELNNIAVGLQSLDGMSKRACPDC